jgi:hypothetical protein
MIGSPCVMWWTTRGHWLLFVDGVELEASWVRLEGCVTDVKQDGFREFTGGPRGIVRGTLVAWEPVGEAQAGG